MKTLNFNTIEIPVVEENGITYLEVSDVELACKMRLSLYESTGYSIKKFNKKTYVPIIELITRLNLVIKKKDADVREIFKEKLISMLPPPVNPQTDIPMIDTNKLSIEAHLNLALELLNQNCEKCSVNYDTDIYPCDQCITNSNFISHFKP